jgi:hypothetical protein
MQNMSEATSSAFTDQLVRNYKIGFLHMQRFCEDLSDERAREIPEGHMPAGWYVAHLMCSHDHFLKLYVGPEDGLDDDFVASYAGFRDDIDLALLPPLSELNARFEKIWSRGRAFLETLKPEDLARGPSTPAAHPSFGSVAGAITVLGFHDAYHAGQLADLRRALGMRDLSEEVDIAQFA